MHDILSQKHYRGVFYFVFLLLLFALLLIRGYTLPSTVPTVEFKWMELFVTLLDGLIISLVVTVFVGGFIFWLTPEIVKRSEMEVIPPKQIAPLLETAQTTSKYWAYKGACGRYLRNATLPRMAEFARNESLARNINALILDPRNDVICDEYANYRRSLKSAKGHSHGWRCIGGAACAPKPWNRLRVKSELYATILKVLAVQQKEPLLKIELHLLNAFSAFRFDISDKYVVVTKEDREASGLRADQNTYFYDSYKDDIYLSQRQAEILPFNGTEIDLDTIDGDGVMEFLNGISISAKFNVTPEEAAAVVTLVRSHAVPYKSGSGEQ